MVMFRIRVIAYKLTRVINTPKIEIYKTELVRKKILNSGDWHFFKIINSLEAMLTTFYLWASE